MSTNRKTQLESGIKEIECLLQVKRSQVAVLQLRPATPGVSAGSGRLEEALDQLIQEIGKESRGGDNVHDVREECEG